MNARVIGGVAAVVLSLSVGADVTVEGKFVSTTTGEPPLEVASSDLVSNLNAELLDGFTVGDFATEGSGIEVHWKNLVGLPVREIDQDCALAGCFDGDPPGFPVTISEPGSYRLTSSLDLTQELSPENVTAIYIFASGVTLDLGGYWIVGNVNCAGVPPICSASGTGIGIDADSAPRCSIRNGVITGMGSHGVESGNDCHVEGLRLASNAGDCINAGQGNIVRGNSMRLCGGRGIAGEQGSLVLQNTAIFNASFGIELDSTSGFGENVLRSNNGSGTADQSNGGVEIALNVCQDSTTCP